MKTANSKQTHVHTFILCSGKRESVNFNKMSHAYISVDAYVACGGQTDKSGHVHRDTLVKIIKKDFGLPINIEVGPFAGH